MAAAWILLALLHAGVGFLVSLHAPRPGPLPWISLGLVVACLTTAWGMRRGSRLWMVPALLA
ncbi:MAG: hypothetical protein AB1758_27885, partial [Candidatus Eremiobacterota bacterium]